MPGKLPEEKDLKFRRVSKKEVLADQARHARVEKIMSRMEKEKEQREVDQWKPKKETIGICHCEGAIIVSTTYVLKLDGGIWGTGKISRRQSYRVEHKKCFCERCGASYNAEVVRKRHG